MIADNKWFWLLTAGILLALIYVLSPVLAPFLTALLLAYMSSPVLKRLTDWHVPRILSVLILFILVFVLLGYLVLLIVPMLSYQITWLLSQLPILIDWLYTNFEPIQVFSLEKAQNLLASHWQEAGNIILSVTSSGLAMILWLGNLVLIPVVAFYLMRDWDNLLQRCQNLLPRPIEPVVVGLLKECNEMVGAFFRGQLLVMLALGIIYSLGLWLAGLKTAVLIGFISGLVSIVPYLGFILGMAIATVVALLQFDSYFSLIYIFLAFGVGQMIESMVLTPLLVGDRIGLHPVAVIFAILAGGQLFGFVGVLLALPFAAVLAVLFRHIKNFYQTSSMYTDTQSE